MLKSKVVRNRCSIMPIIGAFRISASFCNLKTILLLIVVLILPGLASSQEMKLRLLIWEGYAPDKYSAKFEDYIKKKYDIKIKMVVSFVSNSDSFFNPIRSREVDIISPTYHMFKDERWGLMDRKLILPLNLDNIPNFKYISTTLRNAEYLERDGEKYAIPLAQGPYGLAYNTQLVKTAPESWKILWDPAYKGKYVIAENEYMHNNMLTALALGYPRDAIHKYDRLNNKKFKEKLTQLAKNAHSFWDGVDKTEDLLGHSLATTWGFALKGLKEKGEIWKMANPKEGTVYWVDNYAITWAVRDKPILRKIAEEWCNYVLSPEFQVEVIMRELTCYPVITNIQNRVTADEMKQFHLDAPEEYQKTRISESDLSLRDRNGLKLLWDNAKKERN